MQFKLIYGQPALPFICILIQPLFKCGGIELHIAPSKHFKEHFKEFSVFFFSPLFAHLQSGLNLKCNSLEL